MNLNKLKIIIFLTILLFFAEGLESEDEDIEGNRQTIGQVLQDEVLEAAGRLHKPLADLLQEPDPTQFKFLKCKQQKQKITCMAVSADEKFIFSGSKDKCIVKCK